jgi:hypothetical protein
LVRGIDYPSCDGERVATLLGKDADCGDWRERKGLATLGSGDSPWGVGGG